MEQMKDIPQEDMFQKFGLPTDRRYHNRTEQIAVFAKFGAEFRQNGQLDHMIKKIENAIVMKQEELIAPENQNLQDQKDISDAIATYQDKLTVFQYFKENKNTP